MRSCWQEDPLERPSFKQLTRTFELLLEDGTDYLDLTSRFVYNRTYFTDLPDQGISLDIEESSSDNEEPFTKINGVVTKEDKIGRPSMIDPNDIVAHYVNEKVTLEGYDSPRNTRLIKPQEDISLHQYVNTREENNN